MKISKKKITEACSLLNEFQNLYSPKNKIIEETIQNAKNSLSKNQVPQVVLQHFTRAIYTVVFIEKITIGNPANEILMNMDKLSRSNGYFPFGTLFNVFR